MYSYIYIYVYACCTCTLACLRQHMNLDMPEDMLPQNLDPSGVGVLFGYFLVLVGGGTFSMR